MAARNTSSRQLKCITTCGKAFPFCSVVAASELNCTFSPSTGLSQSQHGARIMIRTLSQPLSPQRTAVALITAEIGHKWMHQKGNAKSGLYYHFEYMFVTCEQVESTDASIGINCAQYAHVLTSHCLLRVN
jgi:hypothetical protein